MPLQIGDLVKRIQPEIIVITGHDSYSKNKGEKKDLRAYRNSAYYSEAVRDARELITHLVQLVIFAGACQSLFVSFVCAGATFFSYLSFVIIHSLGTVSITTSVS